MLELLGREGWFWALAAGSAAVWMAAIWTVFSFGKFRRKWLWALLTLLSFGWTLPMGDGWQVTVGIPLGAIYVLLFAILGPRARPGTRPLSLDS